MMKKQVLRSLAAVLCLVMALSLFVPALAATPMGGEVAEVPAETPSASGPIISVGGTVTPAVADDEPAGLTAANLKECSFPGGEASNTTDFTVAGDHGSKAVAVSVTIDGKKKSFAAGAALKMDSHGSCTFTANAGDTVTVVLSHKDPSKNTFKLNDDVKTFTNNLFTEKLTAAGTYKIQRNDGETYLYYVCVGNSCDHDWVPGEVTTPATCGEPGEQTYTCSKCGETKTVSIDPTGKHTWSDTYDTITEPTCTETGLEGKVCSVCHAVSEDPGNTRPINMVPHTYKNGTSGICLVCNYDSTTGGTHTHEWIKGADTDADGWKVTTPATCQAAGDKQRTCSNPDCGKVEHGTVAKLPHSFTGAGGTCVNGCGQTQEDVAGNMSAQGGWLESAYIEWPVQAGVARYEVYVKEASAADYPHTPIDDQLIRRYPGDLMRADALGLVGNKSYKMKVVAYDSADKELPGMTLESGLLEVKPHIREGYAFWSGSTYKTGSGAYNDDGTLKDDAVVVYVDNNNFDSIHVTVNGTSFTGVQALVNEGGASKLAPGTPICIRILGTIDTNKGFPSGSWGNKNEGLQIKGAKAYTNKNLTIEGVGNDAAIHSFGIFMRNCANVEVRNLGIFNCKDDGVSIDTDNCNLWVHNMDIFYGQDGGGDKAKGDGALDTKQSKQITHSFNHFWDCGKCNLQGMKSETTDNTITYHHNWYDHADSRLPRVRTGTVHVYNNYYDGNAKYGVGSTMGSSVFVENNYFRNCKHPMLTSLQGTDTRFGTDMSDAPSFSGEAGGVIKAFGNTIIGGEVTANGISVAYYDPASPTYSVDYDAYLAKTRDETVPSSVKSKSGGNTYNNFDTASDFYPYNVQTPEEAMNTVTQYAGRVQGGDFKWKFDNATEDANYKVIPALRTAVTNYKGTLVSVGGHVDGGVSGGDIAVSKVTVLPTAVVLKPGETEQLTANIVPSTATDKAVNWSTSNAAVATVSDDGLVTAVAKGSATITVTTDDGGKTADCAVTVSDAGEQPGPTPGVDKSDLVKAISNANAAKAGVVVSANGEDVPQGTFWVPQSAMTALTTAISTATGVNTNTSATQAQVNTAVTNLNSAVSTFNRAKADGKKVETLESDYLAGPSHLHYTVNTAGGVTVTDTIPAGNLVFASYWKGDKFLGAKTVTKDKATTALSGWDSIKLIWIDGHDVPQCEAKTVTAGGGNTPDPGPGPVDPPTPGTTEVHTFESVKMTNVEEKGTTWTNENVVEVDAGDAYFKALVNKVTRVDASTKKWPADADKGAGYESTQRFNPGAAFSSHGEGIKFTTSSANAKVQIWWVQTGGDYWKDGKYTPIGTDGKAKDKDLRQVIISKGTDKTAAKVVGSADAHSGTTAGADDGSRVKQGDVKYNEFTLADAGTYIVGGEGGPVYLWKIVVTETK